MAEEGRFAIIGDLVGKLANLGKAKTQEIVYFLQSKLNPNSSSRAMAYMYKGQYDLAIDEFNKVTELNPNDAWAYFGRGVAYRGQAKNAQAVAEFEKCMTLAANQQLTEMAKQHIEELTE